MAQLNLRERVVEATIAYVGADPELTRRNLDRIQRDTQRGRAGNIEARMSPDGRGLSLDWRPRESSALNDCDLCVKVVAAEAAIAGDAMARLLSDADGVVVSLFARGSGEEANQAVLANVRGAVLREGTRALPVVVQMDEEGLDASALAALPVEGWPRVSSHTSRGEGVMETLQRAVEVVMDSMQNRPVDGPAPRASSGTSGPRVEGNPLLGALRQILQATVAEQVTRLEERLVVRLDEVRRGLESSARTHDQQLQSIVDQLDGLGARLDVLSLRFQETDGDVTRRIVEVRDALRVLGERGDAPAESMRTEVRTLIDELRDKTKHWFT